MKAICALHASGPNLCRAVDSTYDASDFLFSSKCDSSAAEHYGHQIVSFDGSSVQMLSPHCRGYRGAQATRELGQCCRFRAMRYLVEQDHRIIDARQGDAGFL